MNRLFVTLIFMIGIVPQLISQELSNATWKTFTSHYEGKTHKVAAVLESGSIGNTQVHIVNDGTNFFLIIHHLLVNVFDKKEEYEVMLTVSKGTEMWVYKFNMKYSDGTLVAQLNPDSKDKDFINNLKSGLKLTVQSSNYAALLHEFTLKGSTAALKSIDLN